MSKAQTFSLSASFHTLFLSDVSDVSMCCSLSASEYDPHISYLIDCSYLRRSEVKGSKEANVVWAPRPAAPHPFLDPDRCARSNLPGKWRTACIVKSQGMALQGWVDTADVTAWGHMEGAFKLPLPTVGGRNPFRTT